MKILGKGQWPFRRRTVTSRRGHRGTNRSTLAYERLEPRLVLMGGSYPYGSNPLPMDSVAPDFEIVDANPASATYIQTVSPRDYLGQVSVWLFGWST